MKRFFALIFFNLFLLWGMLPAGEHPSLFISSKEAKSIAQQLQNFPLLASSFQKNREMVDHALEQPIDVPPPGEAGGYEHERHKQNYREMRAAGLLFQITGQEKYAQFIRRMLLKYAKLYPTLGAHPLSHNQSPGKLFHQSLNEAVWLVYTVQAYDCIYDWLSEQDRSLFEKNIFRPMARWLSDEHPHEFNRIHNHGTWAVTAVGMLGLVLDDQELVDKALYGTEKNGQGGFLKQLDLLFSPDGYYMEGPYYIRYALRPFFLFAEALERNRPKLKIFAYRDSILKKAYFAAVKTTFPDGVFPPINDASRTMNVAAVGVVIANDIAYYRYGKSQELLGLKKLQGRVVLNICGLTVARDFGDGQNIEIPQWPSVEFRDGFDGQRGGLGILRTGKGNEQTMLLMKYGVHGKGHGHFDKLHFILYDQGRSVVPDYGFARWINMEPKFGGRYLPENTTYAKQTVAHNTVVVDQVSQNRANRKEADKVFARRHFFDASNPQVQVMSAISDDHYPGVHMQRTLFLIHDPQVPYPFVVDLYRLTSRSEHVYDYVLHFDGQFVTSNWTLTAHDSLQLPMGTAFGYQHLWNEAEGVGNQPFQFTWVSGQRYYSFLTAAQPEAQVFFTRIGAHDPHFNLRSEPGMILRVHQKNSLFASVIEPHGYFNEAEERSENARPAFSKITVLGHNDQGSVVEIARKDGAAWRIMVTNQKADEQASHQLKFGERLFSWRGNYKVEKIK
nr:PL17 alginate lyase [uncultured bacterium]